LIDAHLPIDLRAHYLKMLAGEKVATNHRQKVQEAVAEILGEGLMGPVLEKMGSESGSNNGRKVPPNNALEAAKDCPFPDKSCEQEGSGSPLPCERFPQGIDGF
jgi:hypothetical protein